MCPRGTSREMLWETSPCLRSLEDFQISVWLIHALLHWRYDVSLSWFHGSTGTAPDRATVLCPPSQGLLSDPER